MEQTKERLLNRLFIVAREMSEDKLLEVIDFTEYLKSKDRTERSERGAESDMVGSFMDGEEAQRARQVLLRAGIIRSWSSLETAQAVPEATLIAAAKALGKAGSLSDLILAEREGR